MKKPNSIINMLFIRHWNFTLFRLQVFIVFYWSNVMAFFYWNCFLVAISFSFDFWGCLNVIMNGELWIINLVVLIMGGIFKKQCKHLPSASAEALSKGIIFYLFIGIFWLLLLIADATNSVQFTVFSLQHKLV